VDLNYEVEHDLSKWTQADTHPAERQALISNPLFDKSDSHTDAGLLGPNSTINLEMSSKFLKYQQQLNYESMGIHLATPKLVSDRTSRIHEMRKAIEEESAKIKPDSLLLEATRVAEGDDSPNLIISVPKTLPTINASIELDSFQVPANQPFFRMLNRMIVPFGHPRQMLNSSPPSADIPSSSHQTIASSSNNTIDTKTIMEAYSEHLLD